MPDPAVPVAAPDVVERLQRQLTIPLSIMGGESYVLDTDDVREATAEITRLRARVAELEAALREAKRLLFDAQRNTNWYAVGDALEALGGTLGDDHG